MATLVLSVGDADTARVYQIQLSLDGHRVLMAEGPGEAAELCRTDTPDLLVSDRRPADEPPVPLLPVEPGMTAPQLSRAVRRRLQLTA